MSLKLSRLVNAHRGNPEADLRPSPTVLPTVAVPLPGAASVAGENVPFNSVLGPLPLGAGMAVVGDDLVVDASTMSIGELDCGVLP